MLPIQFPHIFIIISVMLICLFSQESTANNNDTTVLIRIDTYGLEKNAWTEKKRIDFFYDNQKRMSGWSTYYTPDEKTANTASIVYRDDGEINRISIECDKSSIVTNGIDIDDIFVSNSRTYSNLYKQVDEFLWNVYDIESDAIPGIDSMYITSTKKYSETGITDTTGISVRYYEHKGNTVTEICSLTTPSGILTTCRLDGEYQYHFNSSGLCDSIVSILIPYDAPPKYNGSFNIRRENGRVIAMSTVNWTMNVSYLPSGLITSYLVEKRDTQSDSLIPSEKLQFTYGFIPTENTHLYQPKRTRTAPEIVVHTRDIVLLLPDGIRVTTAGLYDLRGRMISRCNTQIPTDNNHVIFQTQGIKNTVSLFRVSTNQGEFDYKVCSFVTKNCRRSMF